MFEKIYKTHKDFTFPKFFFELTRDMFCIVQYWESTLSGPKRGRAFEQIFYNYCEYKNIDLLEKAGSRTIRGQRAASGFMHENDAVIATPELTIHIEMKYLTSQLHKNELLIFNQKGIDFLMSGNKSLYSKPFYRIILSGHILSPEARRFALNWGIHCIEPDRLPLLFIYELAMYDIGGLHYSDRKCRKEIKRVVPLVVTSLQSSLKRISDFLEEKKILFDSCRADQILNVIQREYGDDYWITLDNMSDGKWLEDHFEMLSWELGLDEW